MVCLATRCEDYLWRKEMAHLVQTISIDNNSHHECVVTWREHASIACTLIWYSLSSCIDLQMLKITVVDSFHLYAISL